MWISLYVFICTPLLSIFVADVSDLDAPSLFQKTHLFTSNLISVCAWWFIICTVMCTEMYTSSCQHTSVLGLNPRSLNLADSTTMFSFRAVWWQIVEFRNVCLAVGTRRECARERVYWKISPGLSVNKRVGAKTAARPTRLESKAVFVWVLASDPSLKQLNGLYIYFLCLRSHV